MLCHVTRENIFQPNHYLWTTRWIWQLNMFISRTCTRNFQYSWNQWNGVCILTISVLQLSPVLSIRTFSKLSNLAPFTLTLSSAYPFEQICVGYFHIGAHSYLCIVDHFSGWICVYLLRAHEVNNIKLQNIFRDLFIAYGVSEELCSDGDLSLWQKVSSNSWSCGVSNIDSHWFHTHNLMAMPRLLLNQQSVLFITIYQQMEA